MNRGASAYERWIDESFEATNRAKSVADWLRGIAWVIGVLATLGAAVVAANEQLTVSFRIAFVAYTALSLAVTLTVLAAIAAVIDLLRIQSQAALYSAEEEDE